MIKHFKQAPAMPWWWHYELAMTALTFGLWVYLMFHAAEYPFFFILIVQWLNGAHLSRLITSIKEGFNFEKAHHNFTAEIEELTARISALKQELNKENDDA